jgi:hypothetical protein
MLTPTAMDPTGNAADVSASHLRRRISQLLEQQLPIAQFRTTQPRSAPPHRSMAGGSHRVTHVSFNHDMLVLRLADECVLTVPLAWYPRLQRAPAAARGSWMIAGNGGDTVLWPDIDQTLTVASLLGRGRDSGIGPLLERERAGHHQ